MNIYFIPLTEGKFIIYLPLKKLAFVGNASMVDLIKSLDKETADKVRNTNKEVISFLEGIGFFTPDHKFMPKMSLSEVFNPTVAVLCLTNSCNFRCIYCYADGGVFTPCTLSKSVGQIAIDTVYNNTKFKGEKEFTLGFHGGGEPTLKWDLFKHFVQYAREKDIPSKITVASNGYWSKEKRKWIIDNLDSVSLSFDGIEKIHNVQRPLANNKNSFSTTFHTIQEMDKNNFSYGIRLTVTDSSINFLEESISFLCRETACQVFQVEPAFGYGRAIKNNTVLTNNKKFVKIFLKAFDIASENGRHLYYSGARPWVITNYFCSAPLNALIVTPENDVSACYEVCNKVHPLHKRFFIGEINSEKYAIFETKREQFFDQLDERKRLCRRCFCYWHCAGDCPSKIFKDGNDIRPYSSERCKTNQEITKGLLLRYISSSNGVWTGKFYHDSLIFGL